MARLVFATLLLAGCTGPGASDDASGHVSAPASLSTVGLNHSLQVTQGMFASWFHAEATGPLQCTAAMDGTGVLGEQAIQALLHLEDGEAASSVIHTPAVSVAGSSVVAPAIGTWTAALAGTSNLERSASVSVLGIGHGHGPNHPFVMDVACDGAGSLTWLTSETAIIMAPGTEHDGLAASSTQVAASLQGSWNWQLTSPALLAISQVAPDDDIITGELTIDHEATQTFVLPNEEHLRGLWLPPGEVRIDLSLVATHGVGMVLTLLQNPQPVDIEVSSKGVEAGNSAATADRVGSPHPTIHVPGAS